MQKIKDKYADQDEDEREAKLQLLGAKKTIGFEKTVGAKKEDFTKKPSMKEEAEPEVDEEEVEDAVPEEEQIEESKEETTPNADGDQELGGGADDAGDEEEEEEDVDADKKEIDQLMKEEDINVVPEDVDLAEIDKLTGLPKQNDIVLGLVPMCAPYSAISAYKYKVKLQVGTLKRGKAQKLIKNLFQQQAQKTAPAELAMIRNIPDPDMTNMLINNVRVLAPGLTKVQNQTKQAKRSAPKKE